MKNYILIFALFILTSCAGSYQQATYVSNKTYIGMPIADFRTVAGKKAKLEAMEAGYTVYRITDYPVWTTQTADTKFYYFDSDGKLVKVDGGEFKQKRYQVEVINR